jgi:hypothetical protein
MLAFTLLLVIVLVGTVVNADRRGFPQLVEKIHSKVNKADLQRNIRTFDRVFATSTTHQWLSEITYAASSSCSGDAAMQETYGTNFCVAGGSSSFQYTYTGGSLYYNTYSDTACTTTSATLSIFNATGLANTCQMDTSSTSTYYQVSSSFSTPSSSGYVASTFSSSSNCNSNMPFEAVWITLSDDVDELTISCTASSADDDYATGTYVSASTTGGSSSSKKCFAGSETVLLSTGETIPISDVKIGDSILAADKMGNTKFSQVISLPHDKNDERATFAFLTTATGRSIKMTPEHIVMVDPSCGTKTVLMKASEVEKDMCLVTVEGQEQVTAVSSVSGNGIYTVITNEEMVVVNGIIASPFAVNHATSHAWYNVFRAAYSVAPGLMGLSLVKQANLVFGSILDSIGM